MKKFLTLLVEDDHLQREVLADLLKDDGYDVIECSTAEAAELIVATSGTELQAVVTDNNLAGDMTGAELAGFARTKFPNLNVVVMSGDRPAMPIDGRFLQKPFPAAALLAAVRA